MSTVNQILEAIGRDLDKSQQNQERIGKMVKEKLGEFEKQVEVDFLEHRRKTDELVEETQKLIEELTKSMTKDMEVSKSNSAKIRSVSSQIDDIISETNVFERQKDPPDDQDD